MIKNNRNYRLLLGVAFGLCIAGICSSVQASSRPNVILVMTDDQGYGDLGCHGNPILKTPELDKLHAESVRFTDFHVSAFCTPTRASLMTGQHAGRTGAYRTTGGLSILRPEKKTVANLFADNGYATGMFGKWHLGDNAPQRPQDKGFQDVVWHRCGGIGQASDYWGNDYFDDTFERVTPGSRIGEFEKFEGYCTDVFFGEALRFVEQNKEKPFFLYLALNAPHGPYRVAPEWEEPYKGNKQVTNSAFYGMIANIDWNMGLFRKRLEELGVAENTILIFMTDNGTSGGGKFRKGEDSLPLAGYNAGMRGRKSSIYEGGQRVPFFIYWPEGDLTGGKDIETLAAHLDVLPTLAELCGMDVPDAYDVDGLSLVPLLKGEASSWPRDHLVIQHHGGRIFSTPLDEPLADTVVMTETWRLVNSWRVIREHNFKLYDIENDFSQENDISADHPEVVEQLKALYQPFWEKVSPIILGETSRMDLGNLDHNPTELCSQDWVVKRGYPPYSFGQIKKLPRRTAPWMVDVKQAGRYRFTLRQWPEAANKPVVAVRAKVEIAGKEKEVPVSANSKGVVIEMDLPAGPTELVTYLYDEKGKAGGAYFTEVEFLQ
ncbi:MULTISPECIES: arylsulfatase [unclassified Lentimonas]|uniref:arylsulfatase n=1 Tax=unclassified Lentimonas TaxID=2630993 RepID=UPI0013265EFB|nr:MULTISPECIES: arylsulfatase [unclassified Lentimonas]CAA6683909.1 Choline-sulfatase (EC [Lentimonas sp. CC6]CAA7169952.1 Choline-sulfatase (EC [Lentimonas sp. CC21]CAA6677807.1 Choline-sulfatase (EC [Lentimonas sp. CC4]CAA7076713.1 Choline-sulfatase (EC [Lentimonas sp. CC4]CAA7181242.1 Choline-sulfatase (EC [Lentimonas sp. CC8]